MPRSAHPPKMSLQLFMLFVILLSAIVVLCDRSLYYLPVVTTLIFIAYLAMKEFPFIVEGLKIAAQKMPASGLGASGVASKSEFLTNAYQNKLHKATIDDNRWITTAAYVNPDERVDMTANIRGLDEEAAPIQGTPTVDVASGRYLNIDRNIGGFRIDGADQYAKLLMQQRANNNDSYYADTAMPRAYMMQSANDKVANKVFMSNQYKKHTWFKT
jgi:hypothetical protein